MGRLFPVLVLLALTLSGAPSRSAPTTRSHGLDALMRRTQQTLEPGRATLRRIAVRLSDRGGSRDWLLHEARRTHEGDREIALVVLEPRSLRGGSVLIRQHDSGAIEYWTHSAHASGRIERGSSLEPVLGAPLTAADLGLVDEEQGTFALIGGREQSGSPVYEVSQQTKDPRTSEEIVNWLHSEDLLPVRREFHAADDGRVIRREYFDRIEITDGFPTPLLTRIVDLQEGTRTRIEVQDVRFEAALPDDLLAPERLDRLSRHSAWSRLSVPVEELVERGFAEVVPSPARG